MEVKINELPELTDLSGSHIVGYKGNDTVQISTDAVVSKAQEIISDVYSATKAYTIGEYCIYNNSLYKCIANTSAGIAPTNSTYWTNTSVSEELASNIRAIDSLSAQIQGIYIPSGVNSDLMIRPLAISTEVE